MIVHKFGQIQNIQHLNKDFIPAFKKIKTVFSDIDGTAIISKTTPEGKIFVIPPLTITAIEDLKRQRMNYIPITGTTLKNIDSFVRDAKLSDNLIITQNGGVVFNRNKVQSSVELSKKMIKNILDEIKKVMNKQHVCSDMRVKIRNEYEEEALSLDKTTNYVDRSKDKLTALYLFVPDQIIREKLVGSLNNAFTKLYICETRSGIDVSINISKEKAIAQAAKNNRISLSSAAAIGDGKNDIPMMNIINENNGMTIAMQNGLSDLGTYCNYYTDNVDNDGFYKAMTAILNHNKNYK